MLYPHVQWPVGALLMVAPFDPELHSANSVGRRGMCQWADHSDEAGKTNATWSAVWNGERWAVCDVHLAALARAELTRAADIEVPPNEPAVSPGSIAEQDAAQRNEVPLAERFQAHLLSDVGALQGRYDPHLYRQMIRQHGGVGTAQRLLADPRHTSYGFEKLWELDELERSMEFAVLLPWFRELFTVEEQEEAERRLILHDFPLDHRLAARSASPPEWTREV